jgi:hypothetical protein
MCFARAQGHIEQASLESIQYLLSYLLYRMFNFEHNATVTISPHYPPPRCGASRFQWWMHVALPFVVPSSTCVRNEFEHNGAKFTLVIHNHLDRLTRTPSHPAAYPQVLLVPKLRERETQPERHGDMRLTREFLQAVAVIKETAEHASPYEAFKGADNKIKLCMDALTDHLLAIQKAVPYLVSWTVYPVSLFDVGTIHHSVSHLCPTSGNWEPVAWGVAINVARQLSAPLFLADLTTVPTVQPEMDLCNELLAEAQTALFRHTRRLTVLNACLAVESLANYTFRKRRIEQLLASGTPPQNASVTAEQERKRNRTNEAFLLHSGILAASGRSLVVENKKLYDEFLVHKKMRHQTAHAGYLPQADEARACFVCCCEVVRWLCDVAMLPIKPMLPNQNVMSGFAAQSGSSYVLSAAELDTIRRMFGIVLPSWKQYLAATLYNMWSSFRQAWSAFLRRL